MYYSTLLSYSNIALVAGFYKLKSQQNYRKINFLAFSNTETKTIRRRQRKQRLDFMCIALTINERFRDY
jgi:hypothetical protein